MSRHLIEVFASSLLALGVIWVLISGYDDDDNDGGTISYRAFQRVEI
tara:strand:+ start:243 stop:383 length:141 start_codon:yes stop_codon:yes gene_type:complete